MSNDVETGWMLDAVPNSDELCRPSERVDEGSCENEACFRRKAARDVAGAGGAAGRHELPMGRRRLFSRARLQFLCVALESPYVVVSRPQPARFSSSLGKGKKHGCAGHRHAASSACPHRYGE